MKRFGTGVIVAMFAAAVTVAAQAPQSPQSPANPAAAPAAPSPAVPQDRPGPAQDRPAASEKANTVTLSGCIQNAPAPASAAAGAAAETKQLFVLASAKPAAGAAGAAVGTSGSTASRYELDGSSADLTKHLNHQVEITGTLQSSSASPTGAERAAPGSAAAAPKLKVASIKMVSDKCS